MEFVKLFAIQAFIMIVIFANHALVDVCHAHLKKNLHAIAVNLTTY